MKNQKDFTDWWHEAFRHKYGVNYNWQTKKEFGAMTKCLEYFKGDWELMRQAAERFLFTDDKFEVDNAHELHLFLNKPAKYAALAEKDRYAQRKKEEAATRSEFQKKALRNRFRAYSQTWLKMMAENPAQFMKGFRIVSQAMKKANPSLHKKVCEEIVGFYGQERARKLWECSPSQIGRILNEK